MFFNQSKEAQVNTKITSLDQLSRSEIDLVNHLWAVKDTPNAITVNLNHVSHDGMKRNMTYQTEVNGETVTFTELAGKLTGCRVQPKGMVVEGTGMDMVFSSLMNLYQSIAKQIDPSQMVNAYQFDAVQVSKTVVNC